RPFPPRQPLLPPVIRASAGPGFTGRRRRLGWSHETACPRPAYQTGEHVTAPHAARKLLRRCARCSGGGARGGPQPRRGLAATAVAAAGAVRLLNDTSGAFSNSRRSDVMNEDIVAIFIPITAIIFGVACAIVSIIVGHRQRMQRAELRHRERLAAIDKGLELPPDPPDFNTDGGRRRPRFLLRGLVLVFLGISLTVAMLQLPGSVPYLFGLIPAAVGL